jgi:aspartyl-tRNA(Asn)/glutamyl-tRNA(Gln) amidotransferase subunit A
MPSAETPASLTAHEAARRIRDGSLSPRALVEACLARIRARDAALQAWVHVDESGALAVAGERESEVRAGRVRGPLHGLPVGVKDIFHVAGMPTRAGARPFAHSQPVEDAVSVARLRAAGAIVLGKTATTEFAYRDPAPTRNPWNPSHTPGGSSAGSGAAVAARMVPVALGTQTVGSVLRPAAYCGVVGFKGTHGLVPADGVIPLAWSLDHVGVLARSVLDTALVLGVLVGRTLEVQMPTAPRLGLVPELLDRASPEVAAQLRDLAHRLARAGAVVVEVKLPPSFADIHATGLIVQEAEAAAYHAPQFALHAAEYGETIQALIRQGQAHSAVAYVDANRARLCFRADVLALLRAHDALLTPTAPTPAPAGLGSTGDPSLCAPWSYAGLPAVSLPTGLAASGLPHAVQIVAATGEDARLLGVAGWCERVVAFAQAPEA